MAACGASEDFRAIASDSFGYEEKAEHGGFQLQRLTKTIAQPIRLSTAGCDVNGGSQAGLILNQGAVYLYEKIPIR
jgi:hypothetical protein